MRRLALLAACAALSMLLATSVSAQTARAFPGLPTSLSAAAVGGSLTVTWSAPTADGGATISAYDLQYTEVDATAPANTNWVVLDDVWTSGSLSYVVSGLRESTEYSVQVRAVNSDGDGGWSVAVVQTTTDHGNTQGTATPAALGDDLPGTIEPFDDVDYFSFTIDARTDVWLYTTGDTDTHGYLYNSSGTTLEGEFGDSGNPNNHLNFEMRASLARGTYYVSVETFEHSSSGSYTLHARSVAPVGTSRNTATEITPTSEGTLFPGFIYTQAGYNYFKFVLSNSADVFITTTGGLDTAAALLRANGTQITQSGDSFLPVGSLRPLIRERLAAGTYYIEVELYGAAPPHTGPYSLFIQLVPDRGTSMQDATEIPLWSTTAGNLSSSANDHYFSFTLDNPLWVRLTASSQDHVLSLAWALFDGSTNIDISSSLYDESPFSSNPRRQIEFSPAGYLLAGTYYFRVRSAGSGEQLYALQFTVSEDDQALLNKCLGLGESLPTTADRPDDPLYHCQWHLNNFGQVDGAGQDINVEEAWGTTMGAGITVRVVDDGVNGEHVDLSDNFTSDANGLGIGRGDEHGTRVAGVIAARDNDQGGRGVAPRASISSYKLPPGEPSDDVVQAAIQLAMVHDLMNTAVSNNHWGILNIRTGVAPRIAPAGWEVAIEKGVTEGFGGKGISYVTAGASGTWNEDANLDEYGNHYGVITVCAVSRQDIQPDIPSASGANLWLCAPAGAAFNRPAITTTDLGSYTEYFRGSPAAAPIVSGVVALMRSANMNLTWRDVKLILAASARQNDSSHVGWEQGALRYGSDTDYYWFNHDYGFGVVDAGAAVALADGWTTLPALRELTLASQGGPVNIPDAPASGFGETVTTSIVVDTDYVGFIEFVEINLDIDHDSYTNLQIDLVSPSGATSRLARRATLSAAKPLRESFRLGSARHLGEESLGTWTLQIKDGRRQNTGTLESWSLTFYGQGEAPEKPTIHTATTGDTSLDVRWYAPTVTAASPVTSYDLRYIASNAADKSHSYWTLDTRIWSAGNLELEYVLIDLTKGVEYDLQVRAVSADGAGLWSDVFNGHTTALAPGQPANLSVNPRDLGLGVVWTEPDFTGGELITRYDLRHIASDATNKDDDNAWTEHDVAVVAQLDTYTHNIDGLTNGSSYDVQARATTTAGTGEWSSSVLGTPHVQNTDAAFPATESRMRSVLEDSEVGANVGLPVAASDPNNDPLTYSLVGGTGTFTIDGTSGQILVNGALDAETRVSYIVTVTVSDQRDSSGDVDPLIDNMIDVMITVLDVNEPPVVSGPDDIDWRETDSGVLGYYTATDPENDPIRWTVAGVDRSKFTVSDQGELAFASSYEVDYDEGQRTFFLDVLASDDASRTAYHVTVRLTPVDEPPGIGVVGLKADYPENEIERVVAFLGLDPEGEEVSWELSGDDAGVFRIEIQIFTIQPFGVSLPFGILDFRSPPDYEAPTDVGEDNIYHATVRALDPQRLFAEYDLIVTVTDVANAVNVSFAEATYSVPEGDSVEVTVTLSADPDQTVVIPLTAAGRGGLEDADYGGVPANVTFSAGGSLEQTFRVTTTDDRIDDDGESLRLTFGTPLPDSVSTGSRPAATVRITDDDVAGVTLSETSLGIDEGGSGDYTVVLTSEPTADVTIESRAPASSDLTVNPSSLTFTSGNWESHQTVAVSAADDNDFTDDTGTITHRVTSGDSDYNNRSIGSVAVTVDDDEEVPVTVKFGSANYTVAEGGTVDVTVTLNRDPKREVTIPIERADQNGATSADYSGVPSGVTIISPNTSVTFTVTATQDSDDDDGESVRLSFGGLPDAVTAVTPSASTISITDDDHPIVYVSFEESSYDVNEGGSVNVKLTLSEAPGRSVTVDIEANTNGGGDADDYSVPGEVTFGRNDTEKSISFRATQDSINDDNESVTLALSSTLPDRVRARSPSSATVSINDDDGPGVLITPTALTVPEGRSRTYTVKLTSQPTADVTVTISTSGSTTVTHDATDDMLTFTAANWATNQTVRVSAAEDDADHLDDTATISHSVASTDTDYQIRASDVTVTVTDDEGVPVTVNFKESTYTVPEGDTVDVTVNLNRDPERTVVISITKTNQGGAVNGDYRGVPSSVTFNSGGDTEQTFTVTARPDDDNDDGESVKLTFGTLPDAVTASGATETTIAITDDDVPQVTVSFEESSYRVVEGGSSVEVTVTLSADPERQVTIGISATGQDGATEQNNTGADYSGVPASVTFNDDETEQSFTITAVNDTGDDDGESILLGFGNVPTGVTRGTGVTVTIEDDDVPDVVVSFGAATYGVDEDDSVTVKVKLDRDPERQVVIPITRTNRGTTSRQDYSGVPPTVTFGSDETEQEIRFSATHDTLNDDDESVVIGFGSPLPSQVTVTTGMTRSTTVTIVDDDNPNVTVNFEATAYEVAEGSSVTVTVTLSRDPERSVTIPITATGQDGATSNDYAINPPSLTFESGGETRKSLTFSATDDGVDDDGESVKLVFGSVAGVTRGGDSEATVTIEDDPDDVPAVTVSFASRSYTVAEDGTVEVTLTLSPAPEREVVIPIVRTNERNASDADYVPLPTRVTFASDETEQSFTFTPVDDAIDDDGERVRLALGAPLPRLVRGATTAATVSITDNDTRGVTVRPTSLRIDEGATGEYTVVLGSEPTADVTVTIDAPTNNTDITVDRASLTFTSSNWSSPQRVEASGSEDTDDADDTGTITHTVRSSGDYASVRADRVSVTVLDDEDPQVRVEFDRVTGTVAEGGDAITFTVRLSKDPERTVTIPIRVAHHDGASSSDYTLSVDGVAATSVTFNSRQQSKQITLTAVDDMFDDDDESVTLGFGGLPSGGVAAGTINEVTVSITDNDAPSVTVRFERTTYTIDEGDSFSINVILSPDPEGPVTIPIATTIEDAAEGDYGLPGSVTFNDGQTTESINFTATNDDVDDDSGQVIVRFDTSSLDNVAAGNETTVRITDDDQRGVSVTPAILTVDEGFSDSYDVVLTSEPTGDVSVEITAPANTDITVSPEELTFIPSNWDMPQSVMVSAAADDLDAEDDTGTITHIVSGGDYDSVSASVSVTVDDDEVSVSFERAAYAAAEGGDAVTVTVRLSAPAKQPFTIGLVKTDQDGATEDDYSALPDRLEFAPGETEQSFGFSALADTEADDGESVLLEFATLPPGVIAGEPAQATLTISSVIRSTGTGGGFVGGGGGGGGGPSGPVPSGIEFEWNVERDIEQLDSGHDSPTGAWSDGSVLWLAENGDGADDAVYAYDLKTGERVEEREFELAESNRAPRGLWSNGKTAWVADSGQDRLFAYDLESGERVEEREIELPRDNREARAIWSDGETMWVLDGRADALFAYDLKSGELIVEYALHDDNDDPRGLWSDGVTLWVSNHDPKRIFAYRIPVPDAETTTGEDEEAAPLERVRDEEFTELSRASNNSPRGIWSDGEVMYVADESDGRVYSYNLPDAIDARLASLTLSGVDFGEFDPGRTEYEGVADEGVTETTVAAEAAQRGATVAIAPADAGEATDGHQLALDGLKEITVTVTSADESRTKVYRVRFGQEQAAGPAPDCLRGAVGIGFSLLVYAGGSVEELEACAQSRHITAVYALAGGEYVSYILGAPAFANQSFRELYTDGVPSLTPLTAGSDGPPTADPVGDSGGSPDGDSPQLWAECLRGEIVSGFSLVLYEGGSVDDLAACATDHGVTALYTLDEGEWVSYILGAPELVNAAFRELFADGLAPATPLVARGS